MPGGSVGILTSWRGSLVTEESIGGYLGEVFTSITGESSVVSGFSCVGCLSCRSPGSMVSHYCVIVCPFIGKWVSQLLPSPRFFSREVYVHTFWVNCSNLLLFSMNLGQVQSHEA